MANSTATKNSGLHRALVKPIVSEKAYTLNPLGQYIFKVDTAANKITVRKAVEATFGVNVTRVNIMNVRGKTRNFGRTAGRTSNWKKAIVTLKKGQTIGGQA